MTNDVIALTRAMPDLPTLLTGLYAGGPELGVNSLAGGAVVQLCAPDGRPLVSVEAPLLVQVPGETTRLLGRTGREAPVWWTEARASTSSSEAGRLAGSFAGRLATVLDGAVWPPGAATTDVVPLTTDVSAVPVPTTGTPSVDVLTPTTAVVIQDRPLVPLTSWLSDALRAAAESERALQMVTPPTARLTLPTRTALHGLPNRWVVQDPDHGYYDGLSGAVLHWKDGTFTPVRDENGKASAAGAFTGASVGGERQLLLTLRTRHAPDADLVLGRSLESAFRCLTGGPPAGWSTAEPVNLRWSTRELTDLARARAPRPTWLVVVGSPDRPAIATVRVLRTSAGVEEDVTVAFGYGEGEHPPVDSLPGLAAELDAGHGLVTLLASLRAARRDLTVSARLEGPPLPVTFALGRAEGKRLGHTAEAVRHYRLGDGTDAAAWGRFRDLLARLGLQGEASGQAG
ncbi:hypothetical protein DMH12_21110 [Streptomyces sp. WAC 04229]|uniref:DUF6177 family protein n=1 Tax=Streptomyces sp. WAC 04229 TaxID=2203206 RepID=UPI000F74B293|nr:DUF6177 family protein [Streptomyces sp. WAC 04229]RSN51832.1 hypothetical protein DMH12_21110 [Streptomyces sp. WAC 04229]